MNAVPTAMTSLSESTSKAVEEAMADEARGVVQRIEPGGKVYFRKVSCTIDRAAVGKTQSSSGSSVCDRVKGVARMAYNMTRRNTGTNLTPETQKFIMSLG